MMLMYTRQLTFIEKLSLHSRSSVVGLQNGFLSFCPSVAGEIQDCRMALKYSFVGLAHHDA